jgi:hypothetical protein
MRRSGIGNASDHRTSRTAMLWPVSRQAGWASAGGACDRTDTPAGGVSGSTSETGACRQRSRHPAPATDIRMDAHGDRGRSINETSPGSGMSWEPPPPDPVREMNASTEAGAPRALLEATTSTSTRGPSVGQRSCCTGTDRRSPICSAWRTSSPLAGRGMPSLRKRPPSVPRGGASGALGSRWADIGRKGVDR